MDMTAVWLLICAFLVFFMQVRTYLHHAGILFFRSFPASSRHSLTHSRTHTHHPPPNQSGFALLEAGTVRTKNIRNILLKNVMDACAAAISWWAVGFAFAQGSSNGCGNGFIGYQHFFGVNLGDDGSIGYSSWLFGYAFCATAATIVSGAVAERIQFRSYIVYTFVITSFIYPVIVHWIWSSSGWLSGYRRSCDTLEHEPYFSGTTGLLDFAGSGVVHMVGGVIAFMGAIITGPRIGRFNHGVPIHFEHSNPSQMALGVLILWLGWYGFNAGSTGCAYNCMDTAALAAMNTTISTAAGGIFSLLINIIIGAPGDIGPLLNGILSGAVAITASCAFVEPYGAFCIGMIAAVVYKSASSLLLRFQIDDPVDAVPVHFFCGAWGVLASGFFAVESRVADNYGYAYGWGVFYGSGGKQLGIQLLGIVCITAWAGTLGAILFFSLKKIGWLRAPKDQELQGMDLSSSIGSGTIFGCLRSDVKE